MVPVFPSRHCVASSYDSNPTSKPRRVPELQGCAAGSTDMTMKDRVVVDAFVEYLREHGHPFFHVDRRPDNENRVSSDIDAIAGEFAIEHTSVDTLPNQRRDSDWFMRAAGRLEQELADKGLFRLNVTIEYKGIVKGQDWAKVLQSLKDWISNDVVNLPDGRHVADDAPGVPFRLYVLKASDRPPGVYFKRSECEDATLAERVREQFDRKAMKLAKYQTP